MENRQSAMKQRILITLNDQGGGVMEWNYKELAATLRAQMGSSHPPIVVITDGENNTDREEVL